MVVEILFKDDVQLFTTLALRRCVGRVEAFFGSKSDHEGVGAVASRVKTSVAPPSLDLDWHKGEGDPTGTARVWGFEVMLDNVLSRCMHLDSNASIVAYPGG